MNYVTPKQLHEMTEIKLYKIYRWCKRDDFPAVLTGRSYIIIFEKFEEWMLKQASSLCEEFVKGYKELTDDEKELYEKAFDEAIDFLNKQAKIDNERKDIINLMSE